jgi:hypothetical protein
MKNKTISLIILSLLILNIFPIVSSEIIWSNTITVGFATQESETPDDGNDDNNNENPIIPRHRCSDNENKPDQEIQITTQYGEWKCINNKLQREVITGGLKSFEYGGACGFVQDAQSIDTQKNNSNNLNIPDSLIIMPLVFFILILITLVIIGLVLLIK